VYDEMECKKTPRRHRCPSCIANRRKSRVRDVSQETKGSSNVESCRVNIERIRDMRKTSIEKVIDRRPCTKRRNTNFLWKCVEHPNECPRWY
jgi:hypothetical protein